MSTLSSLWPLTVVQTTLAVLSVQLSYKRSANLSQFVIHRGLIISVMQVMSTHTHMHAHTAAAHIPIIHHVSMYS